MYSFVSLLSLVGFDLVSSSPFKSAQSSQVLKESHIVPSRWHRIGYPSSQTIIKLHVGLKQDRFRDLENHLSQVSDPLHARYGQHLSQDEVIDLVRPSKQTLVHVQDWLLENGVEPDSLTYSPAKDWINVALPIWKIEILLNTTYNVYEHDDGNTRLIRTPEWSLPWHLHEDIDTIQPTTSFFRPSAEISTLKVVNASDEVLNRLDRLLKSTTLKNTNNQTLAAICQENAILPRCLRALYGTIDYQAQAPDKVSMGLNNYLGEISNRSDVRVFLETFRPEAAAAADEFSVVSINGGTDDQSRLNLGQRGQDLGKEGGLDAQTMLGIAFPIPLVAFSTAGEPPFNADKGFPTNNNEPYAEYLQYLTSQSDLPSVISSSYGDDEQTVPKSYAIRICNSFAQLGARGISFLVSSGDYGVDTLTFLPTFPASCPWVTAVGGTKGIDPEVAASEFASGGGFSKYFERPAYQDSRSVVVNYISGLRGKYDGLFNCEGRGYPDVSAQSQNYIIAYDSKFIPLDGTSASCPTVAAIIALVNDALVAAGKPVLGFLNPWLYARGFPAFTDVLSGSAKGCDTDGFPATEGWDAVTGFGTPFFPTLKDLALRKVFRASTKPVSASIK